MPLQGLMLKLIQDSAEVYIYTLVALSEMHTKSWYYYHQPCVNPLPDDKILDWSKLKEFADDKFKFDENGRKLSKWVENTVGKGEIARYEQFLLFPQCFQKACFQGASTGVIVWEWVNPLPDDKILDWSKLKRIADDILKYILKLKMKHL